MPQRKKETAKGAVVLVANAVSDGKGGYLPKGAEVDAPADLASLKAKGLVG